MISKELHNLIHRLESPIKSFRISALEDLIRDGANVEILPFLNRLRENEHDKECIQLFDQVIDVISGKKVKSAIPISNGAESFINSWKAANDEHRMNMLLALPARLPNNLKTIGPQLLYLTESALVSSRVIRIFCRSWPDDKLYMIVNAVNSDSLVLQLSALKTLVHIKPEALINNLPKLLSSNDPQIKALSIRALAKIDKEEALKYLQALLLSSKEEEKIAGLQNCFFLPFDTVKPILLKFFSVETNPELITQAGWIIDMNPDLNVPFYLYEIAERAPEKKAKLIKQIFNEAIKHLKTSGIIDSKFSQYTTKLQDWVEQRNALRFTRQIVALLNVPKIPENLDKHIRAYLTYKHVSYAFNEALKWPIPETVKKHLSFYLNGNQKSDVNTNEAQSIVEENKNTETINNDSTVNSSSIEESSTIESNNDNKNIVEEPQNNDLIIKQILDKNTPVESKIAAFEKLTESKTTGLQEIAIKLLSNNNYELATSALEYLGAVDPEQSFPYLGKCLKIPDIGMRTAALNILINYDFNQAISYLKMMLYSPNLKQQSMGIQCLDQFDFELIREVLTDYLCKCKDVELADAGLLYFAANPSSENVYSLFKIEQAHTGDIAEQAKKLRASCPEPVEKMAVNSELNINPQKNEKKTAIKSDKQPNKEIDAKKEEELKNRLKKEQAKKLTKKPAYAFKEEIPKPNSKDQLIAIYNISKNWLESKNKSILLIVLIIVAISCWNLFVPSSKASSIQNSGAIIASQNVREGTVKDIKNDKAIFITAQNEKFILDPINDGYKIPSVGNKLRISFVPFRKYPDDSLVVRIRSMVNINKFTNEFSGKAK